MSNEENKNRAVLEQLKEAISIESFGQEYYSIFSSRVQDESAKALFRGLSRDEEEHRVMIEKEYENRAGIKPEVNSLAEENREKAIRIFPESPESMDLTETNEVLKLGIRTEERSVEFYSNGAKNTNDESVKKLFLELSGIEKGHKTALENALYYFEQGGSWYGYSPPTLEG